MLLYESTVPSGNAYKVSLLLAQLGVPHETVLLDVLATPSETRGPAFLAKNPMIAVVVQRREPHLQGVAR